MVCLSCGLTLLPNTAECGRGNIYQNAHKKALQKKKAKKLREEKKAREALENNVNDDFDSGDIAMDNNLVVIPARKNNMFAISPNSAFSKFDKEKIKKQQKLKKHTHKINKKIQKLLSSETTDGVKTIVASIKKSMQYLIDYDKTLEASPEKTAVKEFLADTRINLCTNFYAIIEKQNEKLAEKVSEIVHHIFQNLQILNTQVENDEALDEKTVEDLKNALDFLATDTMIQDVTNTIEDKKLQEDMLRSVNAIEKCKKFLAIIVEKEPKEQKSFWTGTAGKIVLVASVIFSLIASVGRHMQEKPQPRLCFLPTQCKNSLGKFNKPTCFNTNNEKPIELQPKTIEFQPQCPIRPEPTLLLPAPAQEPLSWSEKLYDTWIKPFGDTLNKKPGLKK